MQRWKITIEYDGTNFAGWQKQKNDVSVQETIENALYDFCQTDIRIHAAGRTDSGVHGLGQVAHFDLEQEVSANILQKALNAHLRPNPISIVYTEKVGQDFHARFDAINKLYRYHIYTRPAPPTIQASKVWYVPRALDVKAMQEGAKHLVGEHDFTSFRATACQAKSPVRQMDRLDIILKAEDTKTRMQHILIEAEGRAFLHHQMRNIAGTLKLVGDGKWHPDDVKTALEARSRTKGGPTAPPNGLFLVRVDY